MYVAVAHAASGMCLLAWRALVNEHPIGTGIARESQCAGSSPGGGPNFFGALADPGGRAWVRQLPQFLDR